jgi:hypothetical protein
MVLEGGTFSAGILFVIEVTDVFSTPSAVVARVISFRMLVFN